MYLSHTIKNKKISYRLKGIWENNLTLQDKEKESLGRYALKVLQELGWNSCGWKAWWFRVEHKKFELLINLVGDSCNYGAFIITKNGEYLKVDVASPKASTLWSEVKDYYLRHAKETYFRHIEKLGN